ncbi:MAG TPA: hypothetical protein VKZ18_10180 [Polyangia bacterium]|nr:hypothetical protein [Polyangia bacterium]
MNARWSRASLVAALLLASGAARADGAFPDSEAILTPAERPDDILLVTNFGLITSSDDGATWSWSCETTNAFGLFYQWAPPPSNRLLAVANDALVYSDDLACGWSTAGGTLAGVSVTDAFVDPSDAQHVLALGFANSTYALYESRDGGATFGVPLYDAPAGDSLAGVEIARSDPQTIYLAIAASDAHPRLARSIDGGATFTVNDLSATLGAGQIRIIAVDPQAPQKVYLRLLAATNEAVAITADGGLTATAPLTLDGNLTAFARLASGTLLAAGTIQSAMVAATFRSTDSGASFQMLDGQPAIRALSERGGLVYAATNNFGDGYAIGTSTDEGTTWQPLFAYADVQQISPCLAATCAATCDGEAGLSVWPEAVCSAGSTGGAGGAGGVGGAGAGAGGAGAAGTGGPLGTGGAGGSTGGAPPSSSGGCSSAGPPSSGAGGALVPSALLLLSLARARCGRRRRTLGS